MNQERSNKGKKTNTIFPHQFWSSEKEQQVQPLNTNENALSPRQDNLLTEKDERINTISSKVDNDQLFTEDAQQNLLNQFQLKEKSQSQQIQVDSKQQSLEDGRISKFYFQRFMNFEYTIMLFSLIQIVLGILYFDNDFQEQKENTTKVILWFIFILSLIQIFITILRYQSNIDLEKYQLILLQNDNLISSGKLNFLIIEIIIILLQPYPFFNDSYFQEFDFIDKVHLQFKYNWLLDILQLSKLALIIRVLLKKSLFINPRANRICRMYGCEANYQYAIKCLFQDYPITFIALVFACSIITWAYTLRISESPLNTVLGDSNGMDFFEFENCMWCVIITMTTVGYGDFYPRTFIGRLCDIFTAIWGIFIVSMMVVVLTNTLKLSQAEKRAITIVKRLDARNDLMDKAAQLLTSSAKYKIAEQQMKTVGQLVTKQYLIDKDSQLKKYSSDFKNANRNLRNLFDKDDVYEEMARQFDLVQEVIKTINDNQNKLCKYVEENFDNQFYQQ